MIASPEPGKLLQAIILQRNEMIVADSSGMTRSIGIVEGTP